MIPVNEPLLGERELEYVTECIRTGWISSAGRFIEEFEEKWAAYCGMKYGIATSNGTTALQAAVGCIGIQPGDKVIMPTFTIISCAQAIIYNSGVPVLVDSDPRTWCMDVVQVREKVEAEIKKGEASSKPSCPFTSTATPWIWTRSWSLPKSTISRSSKTPPRSTAPSI